MRIKFPNEYNIMPMSYNLPEDYDQLMSDRKSNPSTIYILKPVASSCGRGIKIVDSN